MSAKSAAERHDELVQFGLDKYREKFIAVFRKLTEGGRYPGMPELTDAEWIALFRATPPESFMRIAAEDPGKARALLEKYAALSERYGIDD